MNKKKASFICFLVWFTGIILLIVADQACKILDSIKIKGHIRDDAYYGCAGVAVSGKQRNGIWHASGTSDAFSCTVHSFCAVMLWLSSEFPKQDITFH